MGEAVSWVTPLLILSGVGLLIMSTSARYEALHAEIHALLHDESAAAGTCATHTLSRARILRNALISLYGSAALLSASGLVAALAVWFGAAVPWIAWGLLLVGVGCIVAATLVLTHESALSLRIIQDHAREIESRNRT